MSFFPPIVLRNDKYIGDNVIIEPIARILAGTFPAVYIASNYPEMFIAHPSIIGVGLQAQCPDNASLVDIGKEISDVGIQTDKQTGKKIITGNKLRRVYKAAGLGESYITLPQLFLTTEEQRQARDFRANYNGECVLVALGSRHEVKDWPYIRQLIRHLSKSSNHVFIASDKYDGYEPLFDKLNTVNLIGLSLREFMVKLSAMDKAIGVDTGIMHIAGALGVPITVICYEPFSDLYEPYDNCELVTTKSNTKFISVRKVAKFAKKLKPKNTDIGILYLEGLGGTITISDHAKKIYKKTGIKPVIIVRKYAELFTDNPHIADVETVDMMLYPEAIPKVVRRFDTTVVIKSGVGKTYYRHGRESYIPDEFIDYFDNHPLSIADMERRYSMNMTLLADKTLGLPYDTIESKVYHYGDIAYPLPEEFVVFSNGVDTWHRGLKQTKCWEHEYWEQLVDIVDIPFLQVGTTYDIPVKGAIDMRGKTSISQLLMLLRDAKGIVCGEGGLMHLAYAVGNYNTIIMRGPTRGRFYHYPQLHNIDSYLCEKCHWINEYWYAKCYKDVDAVCMKSITPMRVLNTLEAILDNEDMVEDAHNTPMQLDSSMELSSAGI